MKNFLSFFILLLLAIPGFGEKKTPSVLLEDLTWMEAEKVLKEHEVVLLALGARTKEHGPHLLLKNDYVMAEELKERVMEQVPELSTGFFRWGSLMVQDTGQPDL